MDAAELKPVLKNVTQTTQYDGTKAIDLVRIEYTIGKFGPFYDTLPKTGFNQQAVLELMNKHAQTLQGLAGSITM